MTPDAFIAILALLIAAWAILPEYRRIRFTLVYSWLDSILLGLAFNLVLYLYYYSYFQGAGIGIPYIEISELEANRYVFVIVLFTGVVEYFRLKYGKLKTKHHDKYDRFVNELLQAGKYHILSKFLRETSTQMAVRRDYQNLIHSHSYTEFEGSFIRRLYENDEYMKYLAISYPELGFDLSKPNGFSLRMFQQKFLRSLLEAGGSDLYKEIATLNSASGFGYDIGKHTPVLNCIFGDMKFAQNREVYRPIGNAMISELDHLLHFPDEDQHNWEMTQDFQKNEVGRSLLFVGERYFDIMVTEALKDGIEWHMWLYYYTYFMDRICENYSLSSKNDPTTEFPNRYSCLIDQMFSSMCGWVRAIQYVPEAQPNSVLAHIDISKENNNIPKSSLIAMGLCLKSVLKSQAIPSQFKRYMCVLTFNLYFTLREEIRHQRSDAHDYAQVLLLVLRNMMSNEVFHFHIQQTWDEFDKIPHRHQQFVSKAQYLDDFQNGLGLTYCSSHRECKRS